MKSITLTISLIFSIILSTFGQENVSQLTKFKYFSKDSIESKRYYDFSLKHLGVKNGENVASIGAGNGNNEIQIAIQMEDVEFTLQEIDSVSLNLDVFNQIKNHYEKIMGRKINNPFSIVIGNQKQTNLLPNTYDRIIVLNTYHEVTDRQSIMFDVSRSLRKNGFVVIMESMARKKGQKHQGCNHLKLSEADFISEMEGFNFKLVSRYQHKKSNTQTFYTFQRTQI